MIEDCHLFGGNEYVKIFSGVCGSNPQDFTEQEQPRKMVQLDEIKDSHHLDQVDYTKVKGI
jgi:hypothetical protein